MTSSPNQVGAPSPTWKGSLVSNSNSNVISSNEDTQGQSQHIYPRKYDSTYNLSYYVDYNRNDLQNHYKHNDNFSFQPNDREQGLKKRRRYAPRISEDNRQVSSKDHSQVSSKDLHYYPSYVGEGKENLPSPEMLSRDEYNYHHAPKYAYGAYDAQSYYPYPNEGDWYHCYPYHDGYYYRGHFQPYPHSTSDTGTNIDDNESYHSKKDCRGYSFIDHTYRDFSGVPPTDEDRERYNNKKKEYERRLKEQTSGSLKNGSEITTSSEDESSSSSSNALKKKRGRGNRASKNNESSFIGFMGTNFPARLHDLLSHDEEISDIITWLPHGRSWIVLDKAKFLSKVAPSHFQISKFESFTRQVNGWGFKRITQGPDINSYYHELFLRGMPHLIQWMKRSTSSGSGRRKIRGDPKDEPDFYSISQMYPIPDYYGENNVQVAPETRYRDHIKTEEESSNKDKNKDIIPALPSPIQTKNITVYDNSNSSCSKNIRSSNNVHTHNGSQGTCDKRTLSTNNNHSVYEYYSHYDIHQPNDVTQNYWKGNGGNSSERHYYNQDTNYYHSTSSDHVSKINAKSNYQHYKVHDDQYVDFKPSEGTIGDRESFCWNDTAFVREQEQQRDRKHDQAKQTTSGYEAYSKAHGSPGFSAMISDDTNETSASLLSVYHDEDKSTTKYQNGHCHDVDLRHVSPIRKLSSFPSPITRNPRSNSIDDSNLYSNTVKDLSTSPNWTWI